MSSRSYGATALTDLDGTLYFSADDGRHGRELWRSDGTEAGTQRLSDIAPGRGSSAPNNLTDIGGRLFFSAYDAQHGNELWTLPFASLGTDGTLTIGGTDSPAGDTISVTVQGELLRVWRNGEMLTFPFADVQSISIDARDGNDRLFARDGTAQQIDGGDGEDAAEADTF